MKFYLLFNLGSSDSKHTRHSIYGAFCGWNNKETKNWRSHLAEILDFPLSQNCLAERTERINKKKYDLVRLNGLFGQNNSKQINNFKQFGEVIQVKLCNCLFNCDFEKTSTLDFTFSKCWSKEILLIHSYDGVPLYGQWH